jgi:predicted hotdog family 3-hydroxylacyl-ACP dehydratase
MADYIPDIADLLPQKAPFIMVGELLYADDTTTRTRFLVPSGNPLITDGRYTEGGLLENIAQTVAAGAGYMALREGRSVAPGHIVSVSRFNVARLPLVGDELFTEIVIRTRIPDIIVISGRVTCNSVEIVTCEMKILIFSV